MADMATADHPRRAQFLTDVLLTAVGGGMDYWATIRLYHPTTPPTAILSADDEPDQLLTVTIDTIEAGITTLTTGVNANRSFTMSGEEYWAQFLTANQTNGAAGGLRRRYRRQHRASRPIRQHRLRLSVSSLQYPAPASATPLQGE